MVLIVEDLHWAVESLEPLQLLLNHVTNLPLMIIGSYRHDEAPQIGEQLPAMKRIRLERLVDDEIAQLSASILGAVGIRPDLLELLKRETEGNTFFIVEVIRALGQNAGRLSEIGQAMLPETVFSGGINQVVQRRLGRVPGWARPLLQLAATAGRTLDLTLLDAIYQQYPDAVSAHDFKLVEWLTICSDMAVLDVPNGVWRFSHEKLRETLLSQLAPDDCTEAHRMIAETLESLYPDDISRAEILAEHWYQANNIERELPHLCRIVEYYIDKSTGLDTARNLLQRTLDRLEDHDPRRAMLLVYLSQTYIRIDYGYGEALGLRALEAAQTHGNERATAQALYVLGSHVREQMRYEEAEAYSQKSLAIFQKLTDARGSANNLVNLGIINHDLARYQQARIYYDQSLAIYHELQDEGRVAFLEILIGTLARDQKQFDEAVPRIENGLEIARRIGQISIISHALNNLGMIATEQGDFEKAKHFLLQSLSVNRYVGNQWGLANCYINLGFIHLMLNADDRARNSLMEGIKKAVAIRAMNLALEGVVGLGWLYERSGQFQKAAYVIGMAEPIANIDVNRRIIPLMARLKRHMTPESLQAALEQGSTLDLDTIIANLLGESDEVGTT
jgi:tetratricopeptide (TPR) repeat protein